MNLLITAGPTREPLDPVRYLSNASSGRMGVALAEAGLARGHQVTIVMGPCPARPPAGAGVVRVVTAREMFEAVEARFDACDVFIAAAAVADYRPVRTRAEKIKKGPERLSVELERTEDILGRMARRRKAQRLVGFCLETDHLEARARAKREAKGLDLVVANTPAAIDAETQEALLIPSSGDMDTLAKVTKRALADAILDRVAGA